MELLVTTYSVTEVTEQASVHTVNPAGVHAHGDPAGVRTGISGMRDPAGISGMGDRAGITVHR